MAMRATRKRRSMRAPATGSAASAYCRIGRSVALVLNEAAFAEDCHARRHYRHAALCAAGLRREPRRHDRDRLRDTGAMHLHAQGKGWTIETARAVWQRQAVVAGAAHRWAKPAPVAAPKADDDPGAPLNSDTLSPQAGRGGSPPLYLRIKLTSLPWMRTRSGQKMRVS